MRFPDAPSSPAALWDGLWPVGSIFSTVVGTNPAILLGFGTWVAFGTGRVMVGVDPNDTDFNAAEKTFGAKTHSLDVTQIPSHTHAQNAHNHVQDPHAHVQSVNSATTGALSGYTPDTSTATSAVSGYSTQAATATNQAATAVNLNTGGGLAHNNVQPSIAVYLWKRTA